MVVLIDGPYGIGKTTVAQYLIDSFCGESFVLYDPDDSLMETLNNNQQLEWFKYVLKGLDGTEIPTFLEAAREEVLSRHSTSKHVILPIGLGHENGKKYIVEYFNDQDIKIIHIILEASQEAVESRILGDEGRDTNLAMNRYYENVEFLNHNYPDAIRINTDGKDAYKVAQEIVMKVL